MNEATATTARRVRQPTPLFGRDADEIRLEDYSLSEEQREISATFARFFGEHCPVTRVREAEPVGYDRALWAEAANLGVVSMRLPEEQGRIGLPLVDLALVAHEAGRAAAPIPLAETVATISLLANCSDAAASARIEGAARGSFVSTIGLRPLAGGAQLVPGGAIANAVVALDGDDLVLCEPSQPLPHVRNLAGAPLAWWAGAADDRRTPIASGAEAHDLYDAAVAEWRLLTAAMLVGVGEFAVAAAAEFVKTRLTSGTPLGALQGVAHPLADAQTKLVASRQLLWRAAWFHDNERGVAPELVPAAFVHADEAASFAAATALHMHGGFGFTTESDVSLYFTRARGWSVVGDPARAVSEVADRLVERGR